MASEKAEMPTGQPAEPISYCRRCGRKLELQSSMKAGYGRICIQKEQQEQEAA